MKQVVKVMSTGEFQALVRQLGASQVVSVPGKEAYKGRGGTMIVATTLNDGKRKVIITAGSCVC